MTVQKSKVFCYISILPVEVLLEFVLFMLKRDCVVWQPLCRCFSLLRALLFVQMQRIAVGADYWIWKSSRVSKVYNAGIGWYQVDASDCTSHIRGVDPRLMPLDWMANTQFPCWRLTERNASRPDNKKVECPEEECYLTVSPKDGGEAHSKPTTEFPATIASCLKQRKWIQIAK